MTAGSNKVIDFRVQCVCVYLWSFLDTPDCILLYLFWISIVYVSTTTCILCIAWGHRARSNDVI